MHTSAMEVYRLVLRRAVSRALNNRLPVRWRFQSRRDSLQNQENQKETVPAENQPAKPKQKQKKKSKVEQVYQMSQKGASVKEIAEKMTLSEKIVRSYLWRAKNPEKFRALLKRYNEKKKARLASAEKV
jgi:DNA-binding NarL/FixJ family response regulator